MRKYRSSASSAVRIVYGYELAAGLQQFPEVASAGADFEKLNEELSAKHDERLALRKPLVKTRSAMRFVELRADRVIRASARGAEIADGGRRGPITKEVFPKGCTPVIAPSGKAQIQPLRDLIRHLQQSKLPGIDAYRNEWLPKLGAALEALEDAAVLHDAAAAEHDRAFQEELALRQAHYHEVDRIMGVVRAAFPRDRDLQDTIFPEIVQGRKGAAQGAQEEEAEEEAAPDTTPNPA